MAKHILLTNDDGLDAPGIRAQFDALIEKGFAVTVIAPHVQNSGVGHAITINRPLHAREEYWENARRVLRVDGTPSDCVRLGLQILLPETVDLVVSGINRGFNMGRYVHCSGTVSAAVEALINGVSAIALSLDVWGDGDCNFSCAARIGADIAAHALERPLGAGEMLNVNVPNVPRDRMLGYHYARLGNEAYLDRFYETEEGSGLYVAEFERNEDIFADSDIQYLREGYVTITPLHWDMTVHTGLRERALPRWEA